MYIELKPQSKFKDMTDKIKSRLEDGLFWIMDVVPDKMIPTGLMEWYESYLNKRLLDLKQKTVKLEWEKLALQEAVEDLKRQQTDN